MKKIKAIIIFVFGIHGFVQGQQIYMERTFGGARFETDSLTLSLRDVSYLMKDNPGAQAEFKKARLNNSIAGLIGFSGGLLISVPLITAVIGGRPEWTFAAVGGTLVLISIPITRSFYRHAENAVENYDSKYQSRIQGNFYFTATGGKLVIRF